MEAKRAQAILAALDIVLDAIKVAGSAGVPSGTIYAALMVQGCTLNQFEQLIGILVDAGKVRRTPAHLLIAVGA